MTRDRILTLILYAAGCTVGTIATMIALAAAQPGAPQAPQSTPQAVPVLCAADTTPRPSWAQGAAGTCRLNVADAVLSPPKAKLPTPKPYDLSDPFTYAAVSALAGRFGHIDEWRRDFYSHGLKHGVRCVRYALVTSFGPFEDPLADSLWAAQDLPNGHRRRLTADNCAADPSIPFGTVIWVDGALWVVRDRGRGVTVARARSVNSRNTHAIDCWTQCEATHNCDSAPMAIVGWVR